MKIKRSEVIQLANKYIGNDSLESQNKILLKISTAIAARISYTALGDNPKIDYEADIKLNDRLLESKYLSGKPEVGVIISKILFNIVI